MKRFVVTGIFSLIVILVYQVIDINLFTVDLPRRVCASLYKNFRTVESIDPSILILDIEYMPLDSVKSQLEVLDTMGAKSIGVNLCNIRERNERLDQFLREHERIMTCDCDADSPKRSSSIIDENQVTHFRTDRDSYFEMQLCESTERLRARNNGKERISFRDGKDYFTAALRDVQYMGPEPVVGKVVLVGFLRDSVVTPMNEWYGTPDDIAGDMSDAQISANIISTINQGELIEEVGFTTRVLIILGISLFCVGLIRLVRTKYSLVNIILAFVVFVVLNGLSSLLIVLAFEDGYFLELNPMTIVLIGATTIALFWNTDVETATGESLKVGKL